VARAVLGSGGRCGLGHLLARQLAAAGERVLGVQPKLAARVRLLAAGAVNKNDPNDARSVAITALRSRTVREAVPDDHCTVLRMWSRRYHGLGRNRARAACRLHAALCELVPGGISKEITIAAAAALLQEVTPSGAVQQARRDLAAGLLDDLRRADQQIHGARQRLAEAAQATGTSLTEIFGVGPFIAAAVIGEAGDVSRFTSRDAFASYNGTAPGGGVLGEAEGPPAVPAREPAAEPRRPHDRSHPDPLPRHPGPRLLRQEDRRGQDCQRGAACPETAGQRRLLQAREGRRRPRRSREQSGRARGERLCRQRGRLTPQDAGSSARPLPDQGPPHAYRPGKGITTPHRPHTKTDGPT